VPDHTTLCRRAETLAVPRPRPRGDGEPMHLLVDSTGLKLCGAGEWLVETHGAKTRRSWRKLHIGLDADTGQIVAAVLTTKQVDNGAEVGPLLDQVTGPVASFTADGAYDQEGVSAAVAARHPAAAIVVPPQFTAVPSETAQTAPTQRDRHLRFIAEHGRPAWQKASGYTKRARAEAAIGRLSRGSATGCARAQTSAGRKPSRFHRQSRWNTAGGDRGGRRRPCAQPHAGAWTPDLCPHRLNPRPGWGQLRPHPRSMQHGCAAHA